MALHPENVDLARLPPKPEKLRSSDWGIMDGFTFEGNPPADRCVVYDPRDATAEMGVRYLEASAAYVAERAAKAYEELR